jgi:hypothetical protein
MMDLRNMRFETLRYEWSPENPLSGTDAPAPTTRLSAFK